MSIPPFASSPYHTIDPPKKLHGRGAGKRLGDMMALGASRPWPEALEAGTGQREMDATAILECFAPLKAWLDEQNRGQLVGWKADDQAGCSVNLRPIAPTSCRRL